MGKLDIDSLLDKNPQVDREVIKRARKKAVTTPDQLKGNPISPYGGRRATSDIRLKPSAVRLSRTA